MKNPNEEMAKISYPNGAIKLDNWYITNKNTVRIAKSNPDQLINRISMAIDVGMLLIEKNGHIESNDYLEKILNETVTMINSNIQDKTTNVISELDRNSSSLEQIVKNTIYNLKIQNERIADKINDSIESGVALFKVQVDNSVHEIEGAVGEAKDEFKSEITTQFDINNRNSPISILTENLTQSLTSLLQATTIEQNNKLHDMQNLMNTFLAKKNETELETVGKKGIRFEEQISNFLEPYSKVYGDTITLVGRESGYDVNMKGDIIIEIVHEGMIINPKIVIEAKDRTKVGIGGSGGLLKELEKGMDNRDAVFGIGIVKNTNALPKSNGIIRYYDKDKKIICGFGETGEAVRIAYQLARTIITADYFKKEDFELDVNEVNEIFTEISKALKPIALCRKHLTAINKGSVGIKDELQELEINLGEIVDRGVDLLSESQEQETDDQL